MYLPDSLGMTGASYSKGYLTGDALRVDGRSGAGQSLLHGAHGVRRLQQHQSASASKDAHSIAAQQFRVCLSNVVVTAEVAQATRWESQ